MGKRGKKESLHIYGKGWVRYPESHSWGDKYFKRPISLHVYVWEMYHGRHVPKGYVVHHIDGDPANNEIENLIAMPKSEHARLHQSARHDIGRLRELAKIGREHAKAWHSSPAGRQFHKKLGKLAWENAYRVVKVCEHCGDEYETWNIASSRSRFCSNKCKAAWRRQSGIDDEIRICKYCGREFTVSKYSKTSHCSRLCAAQLRRKPKKVTVCAQCGKRFEDYPSANRVYCSKECKDSAQRTSSTSRGTY